MRQDHTFNGTFGDFHYIDWGGTGPLVHFTHATGFCAGMYTPFVEKLLPALHILGMDIRGHGKTRVPADPGRLKDWDIFADDLEHFFSSLDEPVISMGHSRGAIESLVVAIRRPDLVRALILMDPTIIPLFWKWPWLLVKKTGLTRFVPMAAQAIRRKRVWPDREKILAAYRGKQVFNDWQEGFLEAYVTEGTEETGQGDIKLCCEPEWEYQCFITCPHDVWAYVGKLQQPTLVLYGSDSYALKPSAIKRLKKILPNADFRCLKETGHFLPLEKPDEVATLTVEFLKENKII